MSGACVHCGRPEGEHRHPDRRCFTYVTGMRGEGATSFTPAGLAAAVERMNKLADAAVEKLSTLENAIALSNPAIPYYMPLPSGAHFGWDLVGGGWRLVYLDKNDKPQPIKDAPRAVRIEAAASVDKFIFDLATHVEKWVLEQEAKLS